VTVLPLVFAIMRTSESMLSSRLRGVIGMTHKFPTKPRVADDQRHNLFVAMTQQLGALDDVERFEKAFQKAFKSAFEERRLSKATRRTSNEPRGFAAPR
jgi:hypothetical protein